MIIEFKKMKKKSRSDMHIVPTEPRTKDNHTHPSKRPSTTIGRTLCTKHPPLQYATINDPSGRILCTDHSSLQYAATSDSLDRISCTKHSPLQHATISNPRPHTPHQASPSVVCVHQ